MSSKENNNKTKVASKPPDTINNLKWLIDIDKKNILKDISIRLLYLLILGIFIATPIISNCAFNHKIATNSYDISEKEKPVYLIAKKKDIELSIDLDIDQIEKYIKDFYNKFNRTLNEYNKTSDAKSISTIYDDFFYGGYECDCKFSFAEFENFIKNIVNSERQFILIDIDEKYISKNSNNCIRAKARCKYIIIDEFNREKSEMVNQFFVTMDGKSWKFCGWFTFIEGG